MDDVHTETPARGEPEKPKFPETEEQKREKLRAVQNLWVRRLFLCGVVAFFSVILFFASPVTVRGIMHTQSPEQTAEIILKIDKQTNDVTSDYDAQWRGMRQSASVNSLDQDRLNALAQEITALRTSRDTVQTTQDLSENYILQLKFLLIGIGLLSLTYAGYIYLIVPRAVGLPGLFEDVDDIYLGDFSASLSSNVPSFQETPTVEVTEEDSEAYEEDETAAEKFDYAMRSVVRRLEREIGQLGQRANVNLLIGGIIAGVGIIALGYALWGEPVLNDAQATWQDKALKLGARASFVLLIEFFAFFFLRLYGSTLGEIKYFQNELTNFQSKALAVRTSLDMTAPINLESLLGELVKTERNFVLKKGETTVDLKKAEIEREGLSAIADALTKALNISLKK